VVQWRDKGGKGGHLPPGAALWGRQIEVRMLETNYEMLNVTNYKMSNVIASSHQDHQGSQSEQL